MAARQSANPFNLKDRGGPERPHTERVWTEEEQREKLEGYLEVPPDIWHRVATNSHVRYYTKDKGFRPGGFVVRNPHDFTPKDGGAVKRTIQLKNGFNDKAQGFLQWMVPYEDLGSLHVKASAEILVLIRLVEKAVHDLNENDQKLKERIKSLEKMISDLGVSLETKIAASVKRLEQTVVLRH